MQEEHLSEMWDDFEERRLLPAAFGYRFLDVEAFKKTPGLWHLTNYLHFSSGRPQGRLGITCDMKQYLELLDLAVTEKAVREMEARYNWTQLPHSSLYPLLLAVCRSLEKGLSHSSGRRGSEAFLYMVIALEQVFSETERTTKVISGRSAALLYRQLGLSFLEAQTEITEIYNIRSKFVHKGEPVPTEYLLKASALPDALARALMHVCSLPESSAGDFYKLWLKKLDWVVAGFDAGIEPDQATRLSVGILDPEASSLPCDFPSQTLI